MDAIRAEQASDGGSGLCTLILGERSTPERAAFHNGALVRYLDFMDTYVAPGEACHPSDNIAAVLAAAELAGASGRDFLTALAVAYHAQCRITGSGVPILRAGFDHTIQLALSQAAGVARVLRLPSQKAAHALAISAASGIGLAGSRAGNPVPQWKGLASAATAFATVHNVRLAQFGITGPLDIVESPLGLEHVLGRPLAIDWAREGYDAVLDCSIKRYQAEFHAQTAIEALLELRREQRFAPQNIEQVRIEIFKAAFETIGGGKYVNPASVLTREDADHSLNYLAAVALFDGEVGPRQLQAQRIESEDLQSLLRKVESVPSDAFTRDYPRTMPCRITVRLRGGRTLTREKKDYEGFYRRPMKKSEVVAKFESLVARTLRGETIRQVRERTLSLEERPIADLLQVLRGSALRRRAA